METSRCHESRRIGRPSRPRNTRDSRAFLTRWILSGVESLRLRRLGGPNLCRPVVHVTGALDGLEVSGEVLELYLRGGESFFT
jgi:hypothetical protein